MRKNSHLYRIIYTSWRIIIGLLLWSLPGPLTATESLNRDFQATYYELLGDFYYQSREIPDHLENAIKFYKKAIGISPEASSGYWKATRCYWVIATKRTADAEKRKILFQQGMELGSRGIEATPDNSNAFVWNALIHGNHALDQGVMNAIYTRHKLKEWLDKALELDQENINALLGLAGWYFYVPEFFGGDKSKTYHLIDKAEKIDPNYTAVYLRKAEHLLTQKRFIEARATLQKISQIKSPTLPNDSIEDKATALRLLKKLDNSQL